MSHRGDYMKFKITRYDDKTRLQLIHYNNLRKYYNKLIEEIMGEDYYTISPDVTSSDMEAYGDMINRIKYLKETIECKNAQICLQFIIIVIMLILLFLASMHVIF